MSTKTHILGLGLGALLLLGCPPASEVKNTAPAFNAEALPAEPEALLKIADEQEAGGGARNAVVALEKALQKPEWANTKAGYEGQWRLARAYADLSDPDGDQRASTVPPGLAAAKKATEIQADRVEGHYYYAQLLGFSALLQKGETKPIIQQMVSESEAAAKADEKFDHGGPLRMLGALFARAPKEPVSVGDPEKAVTFMKKAVAIEADFPPNQIYLGEAYISDERYQEAATALSDARKALPDSKWDHNRAAWKDELSRVERKLRAKQT